MFDEGYDLALYLFPTEEKSNNGNFKLFFNVYKTGVDEEVAVEKLKRKKRSAGKDEDVVLEKIAAISQASIIAHAHTLASLLLEALTGTSGLCKHTIAYCVKKSPVKKDIYMSDYLGNKIIPVVTGPGIKLAPTFHSKAGLNANADILFYSLITRENVRQMMRNLRSNKSETCFSFPGLNMQLALAADGIQPNGDVIFCSDFETGFGCPQIYYLDRKKNKTTRLTGGKGYCAAPSYCAQTHEVVYTRLINKQFQLFKINLHQLGKVSKFDEHQLTFCQGDKTEPQWDETGNYVFFLFEFKGAGGKKLSSTLSENFISRLGLTGA